MPTSQTWQRLPPWLQEPLLHRVINLSEAAELYDLWLLASEGQHSEIPPHLESAAMRLLLWETDQDDLGLVQ